MHHAAYVGAAEALEALADVGCDVNREDRHGSSPLHWACAKGHLAAVNTLVWYSSLRCAPNIFWGSCS
jgi:ankyrin repeat protein